MTLSWKSNLPEDLKAKVTKVEKMIQPRLEEIDEQVLYNQQRVLDHFRKHKVAEEDFVPSTGYGFDDMGRDKLEAIYADYFKVDDALVRPQFTSGTHAITVALFSMLRPGDTLYYLTGTPYDTIQEVIGLTGNKPGNMKEWGINFKATELKDGEVVYEQARKDLEDKSINVHSAMQFAIVLLWKKSRRCWLLLKKFALTLIFLLTTAMVNFLKLKNQHSMVQISWLVHFSKMLELESLKVELS